MRARGHESVRVALLGLGTAGVVLLAGGGEAFWVCVPAVLLACAGVRTRLGAVLGGAAIVAAAAAPAALAANVRAVPSPLLAVAVPAACGAVLVVVRERLVSEREAQRHFALTDALTGAANRRALVARIEYEVARHARTERSFVLLMLDLDGFKHLNDRFGHAAGDELLRDVAAALQEATRGQDTVARSAATSCTGPETDLEGAGRLRPGSPRRSARSRRSTPCASTGFSRRRVAGGAAPRGRPAVAEAKRDRRRGRAPRRAA